MMRSITHPDRVVVGDALLQQRLVHNVVVGVGGLFRREFVRLHAHGIDAGPEGEEQHIEGQQRPDHTV